MPRKTDATSTTTVPTTNQPSPSTARAHTAVRDAIRAGRQDPGSGAAVRARALARRLLDRED